MANRAPAPALNPSAGARWLPTLELEGSWQMALDRWLLDQGRPAFRLYRWQRPTLSLGFHQQQWPSHWSSLAEQGVIDMVRRPSGGRAVLHAGDLTYALVWPGAPANRQEAYRLCCTWLQRAFAAMGEPLQFGDQQLLGSSGNCFALRTPADLVNARGVKRIGNAQLWRQGNLLQHGSIPVNPPPELWQQLFGQSPTPLAFPSEELEGQLLAAARLALPAALLPGSLEPLQESEWQQISRLLPELAPHR
ncbi:lipoate--protein ligase family protein [Cyanobium sp. WAJ14-Wanaka]|uniref:lipoate--protein ligase family protein n=1 Tax=Cyanobium sp. WAJ14-Wanaka TaxID=2823725 RepID=UPI0020CC7A80|nr:lipoate--protein ligase family protein [Cyanobium sp. WAJ14-Wanaka]MCP9774786.1 lipoate--protein ligase family protein [Cyanobium sp. WAJ14-Wanaka]